jgi:hypothetical protein
MSKGSANKLFVVPSEFQDLAGAVGTLAGGAAMASQEPKERDGRALPQKNGGADI